MEEHSRDQLPVEVQNKYPQASGGLFVKTQLVMRVYEAQKAFALYQAGAMDEWSFGYNVIDSWIDEKEKIKYRHVREFKMWEYSPVTWGSNEATTTVSVKSNLLTMLEEVSKEHPEFSDRELITAVEKRLSPELPAVPQDRIPQQQKHGVESLRVRVAELELQMRR